MAGKKPFDPLITIGMLAERTGLAVSAIRYYEEQGLLRPERSKGGQRRFLRSDIRRASFILIAQRTGLPIARIRVVLSSLPGGRTPTKDDWTKISLMIRSELEEKLTLLQRLKDNLDGCIGCGCLSLKACKLYNPDDRARASGPGPRRLLSNRRIHMKP